MGSGQSFSLGLDPPVPGVLMVLFFCAYFANRFDYSGVKYTVAFAYSVDFFAANLPLSSSFETFRLFAIRFPVFGTCYCALFVQASVCPSACGVLVCSSIYVMKSLDLSENCIHTTTATDGVTVNETVGRTGVTVEREHGLK